MLQEKQKNVQPKIHNTISTISLIKFKSWMAFTLCKVQKIFFQLIQRKYVFAMHLALLYIYSKRKHFQYISKQMIELLYESML